jgi:hypothetical protein
MASTHPLNCNSVRVASEEDKKYTESLRRNTDKMLAHEDCEENESCPAHCNCVDCYMANYYYDERGKLRMPDVLHMIRQGYYMEQEWRLSSMRASQGQSPNREQDSQGQNSQEEGDAGHASPTVPVIQRLSISSDDQIAKNLFQRVQGVEHDDKCPHDLPYYACMPCSH